jgi:hypothetical protein
MGEKFNWTVFVLSDGNVFNLREFVYEFQNGMMKYRANYF